MNLNARILGAQRIYLDRTVSTMDEVQRRSRDAPEGLTVIANEQTSGRGRAGRQWHAEPGMSLLFSTLLRPECEARLFRPMPLLAGLAIAEAIETHCRIQPAVKWPNDVLIDGRKVCGVLITSRISDGHIHSAVLGAGINLFGTPSGADAQAASLQEFATAPLEAEILLDDVLSRLSEVYTGLLTGYSDFLIDRWLSRAALLGEVVDVVDAGRRLSGTFAGVTSEGALRLTTLDGDEKVVHVGELTRGPNVRPAATKT